jgi:hypothetical protein
MSSELPPQRSRAGSGLGDPGAAQRAQFLHLSTELIALQEQVGRLRKEIVDRDTATETLRIQNSTLQSGACVVCLGPVAMCVGVIL